MALAAFWVKGREALSSGEPAGEPPARAWWTPLGCAFQTTEAVRFACYAACYGLGIALPLFIK